MKRRVVSLLLALCLMTAGISVNAWAADTKIENVEIEFSWDSEPAPGEIPGNISAVSKGDHYRIEEVYYTNEVDVWKLGDTPTAIVVLYAAEGYQFPSTSRSYFTLTGCEVKYKKARTYDSRTTLELTVTFPQMEGRLEAVENAYWNDQDAVWDEMAGAQGYEVKLYRDERLVTTVKTTDISYNFSGQFTRAGEYTFKVRAIASYNNRAGEWSEASEYLEISEHDAAVGGSGKWVQNDKGWWYMYSSGGYPAGSWYLIDGAWYYFNRDGYRLTGWQLVNDHWYYMDGSGVMLTGWQTVNNRRYYMDGSGAMLTGWQMISGYWYYFDASGAMLTNTTTPDGFYVDYSGIYRS